MKTRTKTAYDLMREMADYAVALQQAIEHHCGGSEIPDDIARKCPHHAKMLNSRMKAQCEQ